MDKQLELLPRPRVRLDDACGVGLNENPGFTDTSGWTLPDTDRMREDLLARSKWESVEMPPCQGYWEVTDHKTGTLLARWWFGGVWWVKGDSKWKATVGGLSHEQFVTQYAWRGLMKPHPDVYPCPPYASGALVDRALSQGVTVNTSYVRIRGELGAVKEAIQEPTRTRVRL